MLLKDASAEVTGAPVRVAADPLAEGTEAGTWDNRGAKRGVKFVTGGRGSTAGVVAGARMGDSSAVVLGSPEDGRGESKGDSSGEACDRLIGGAVEGMTAGNGSCRLGSVATGDESIGVSDDIGADGVAGSVVAACIGMLPPATRRAARLWTAVTNEKQARCCANVESAHHLVKVRQHKGKICNLHKCLTWQVRHDRCALWGCLWHRSFQGDACRQMSNRLWYNALTVPKQKGSLANMGFVDLL